MKLIFRRIVLSIPLLLAMTLVSFLLMHWAPGDPTAQMINPTVKAEDLAQIKANLGLNQSLGTQYFLWLKQLIHGNFGKSYATGQDVLQLIGQRLPATLLLTLTSLLLVLAVTLPLGLISGYRKNSRWDRGVTWFSFIGMSIPTFWVALIGILVFSVQLNCLPSSGYLDPSLCNCSFIQRATDIAKHLVLPVGCILIGGLAGLTRFYRSNVISILNEDYIRAARARGISERRILLRHVLKNACLPVVTLLGLQLPELIGGSFVVEYIFAWPGLGQLGIQSVFARDYPVLMATLFFSSVLIIVGNLLADLAYQFLDPRIAKS